MKVEEARKVNRDQINEERLKHRVLVETLKTSYDKTIEILKAQIDNTRGEQQEEITRAKDNEIETVDSVIHLGQEIVDQMNRDHNDLIQEILNAEARNDHTLIGKLLVDARITDVDLFSSRNYIPTASAIETLMDPYNRLALQNDMLKKEMAVVEKAIDELVDTTEERINQINEKWSNQLVIQAPVQEPAPAPIKEPEPEITVEQSRRHMQPPRDAFEE